MIDYKEYWSTDKVALANIKSDVDNDRLKFIAKCVGHTSKLVDIGCGQAHFVAAAKDECWAVRAIDPSDVSKIACKKNNIDMIEFEQIKDFNPFVITMWHLIEHFEDPLDYLRKLNKQVDVGAWLFIETPNKDSRDARKDFEHWWYNQKEHLFYFNPQIIKATLEDAGWKVMEIKSVGGFGVNTRKPETMNKINKYYKLLKPLKKLYYLYSELFGLSDCIRVVAKKRREL